MLLLHLKEQPIDVSLDTPHHSSSSPLSTVSCRDCTMTSFEGDDTGEVVFLSMSASLDYVNNIGHGIIHFN